LLYIAASGEQYYGITQEDATPENEGMLEFQIHTLLALRCRKCHISSSSITTASPGGGFGAAAVDIAAYPAQHRLRRGAEQVGDGVEGQTVAVQADRGAFGRFRRAVPFKASELVSAPLAAPPLLTCDDAEPDDAATAAPRTGRKSGDHQDPKL
jgi:hypothetical protein